MVSKMAPKMHPKFTKNLCLGPAPTKWGTKVVVFRVQVPFMCPQGAPLKPKSAKSREKVVPRSTLENTVRKVLQKRCLGTPSNPHNNVFTFTKLLFSHFHLKLQNN